ncbi:vomeronasal type-2 receptor 26-like [Podarcis lilfordi]|uniref:Vomeronasal type-2 receptor 26-like n=1 Tax=Podarcis lilfordi TaxID=74358 RepID=A0AA35L6K4_9SAUR|nr:vomeronasal type-2 receptor 26-like [Podarcis lilfordi]
MGDSVDEDICTGEEKLESLPLPFFEMSMTGHSYSIYNAVYVVAHALQAMFSSRRTYDTVLVRGRPELQNQPFWQLTFSPAPVMNDKTPGLSFYQMVPQEALQYEGILSLLLHFGWTWIGVIVMDNDNGERFVQTVLPVFSQKGVCFAFIERIPTLSFVTEFMDIIEDGVKINDNMMGSNANVVVIYGESYSMSFFRWLPVLSVENKLAGKVWIATAQVEISAFHYQRHWDVELFHGAIAFRYQFSYLQRFHKFLEERNPLNTIKDDFIKKFWETVFSCIFLNVTGNYVDGDICTGEEKLESLPLPFFEMSMTGHSYSIYNAVYVVAHALQAMFSYRRTYGTVLVRGRPELQNQPFWQPVLLSNVERAIAMARYRNQKPETKSFEGFPHAICKPQIVKCSAHNSHIPLHSYHQEGDLIIGGIASHSFIISSPISFHEEPPPPSYDEINCLTGGRGPDKTLSPSSDDPLPHQPPLPPQTPVCR